MNAVQCFPRGSRNEASSCSGAPLAASTLLFILLTLCAGPALAQYGNEIELRGTRSHLWSVGSEALGIAPSGADPLTLVGWETDGSQTYATCWIEESSELIPHELPHLNPTGDSWARAVVHVPWLGDEHTIVVGSEEDPLGNSRPMSWCNTTSIPWDAHALPTLNAGDGEARGLFLPDGTPLRAMYCGWLGELPPVAKNAAGASKMKIEVPVIWEKTSTGERILRPDYGAGLSAHVNDIRSEGVDGFFAVGGGESSTGLWRPTSWRSQDDGQTWQNDELPLPLGLDSGEATACGGHELGHILLASGYGESSSGARVPLFWELDLDAAVPSWVVHEIPLPAGKEGGQNNHVHKYPGRLTYAGAVTENSVTELALWTETSSGWVTELPADYLANPEAGTPIAVAGYDQLGRLAATTVPAGAPKQTGTTAAVLVPQGTTSSDPHLSPRKLIAMAASPNPFNPRVRISYMLPEDGRVTVTIHDAAGRMVTSFDEGQVPGGVERAINWNGTTKSGEHAASGVYFVRVATGYEIASGKIVLVE